MKNRSNTWKTAAIVLMAVAALGAQAQSIGWNLDRFGTLNPNDTAGVVAAQNWNNSWPSNPTVDLNDNTGAATTLDLAYGSFNQWSIQGATPPMDLDGTANKRLLNGYLNSGMAGWGPPITNSYVALTQIPYAQYNLYVYFSSDVADRPGYVSDGTSTYYFNTLGPASVAGSNAVFAQTTEASSANHPLANYAVFSGLSGAAQTLSVQMEVSELWGGIAGFQVVAVPEPNTVSIGLLGLAALGVRLRFRRP